MDPNGITIIFTLVCCAKETLEQISRNRREQKRLAEEERVRLEDEKERMKRAGTKVTTESFMKWRTSFLKEIAELKAARVTEAQKRAEKDKKNKLTGRQLFEKDKTLAKSDAAFMEEGDVVVDLDLFEDELEGLDLEDDEEVNLVVAGFSDEDD